MVKDLSLGRYDKTSLALQISEKEHRYLNLTKTSALSMTSSTYQRELSLLRSTIDRDRQDMRQVERRIEDLRRRMGSMNEDVRALDGVLAKPDDNNFSSDFKFQGLISENEELKKMNAML